ncbi:hypothetical protein VOLCADRAFT_95240 [Volvox carteri f. nagariensis]|uniref:Uncharacterized protein n=1 Tax=Volvox carteri f. nagariensis TaxID=3068 RepID=D8U6Z4_VOLCA|nr:uncharacterized protein VOLCADRAFT_95240 [Volvox carteri f. nagariensis]EFJ44598.1 hypothetical protein VOLCADRAFT_95240 [Volvox carteri f. nagariensis]|eukprot:XP_002954448.1 hypothetical protein VOLCADRAFT_95240 [Volvox carteri f. nagariensis]
MLLEEAADWEMSDVSLAAGNPKPPDKQRQPLGDITNLQALQTRPRISRMAAVVERRLMRSAATAAAAVAGHQLAATALEELRTDPLQPAGEASGSRAEPDARMATETVANTDTDGAPQHLDPAGAGTPALLPTKRRRSGPGFEIGAYAHTSSGMKPQQQRQQSKTAAAEPSTWQGMGPAAPPPAPAPLTTAPPPPAHHLGSTVPAEAPIHTAGALALAFLTRAMEDSVLRGFGIAIDDSTLPATALVIFTRPGLPFRLRLAPKTAPAPGPPGAAAAAAAMEVSLEAQRRGLWVKASLDHLQAASRLPAGDISSVQQLEELLYYLSACRMCPGDSNERHLAFAETCGAEGGCRHDGRREGRVVFDGEPSLTTRTLLPKTLRGAECNLLLPPGCSSPCGSCKAASRYLDTRVWRFLKAKEGKIGLFKLVKAGLLAAGRQSRDHGGVLGQRRARRLLKKKRHAQLIAKESIVGKMTKTKKTTMMITKKKK